MCTVGHDIWTARVPLICFDVVEWHLPDRVLRQFGQIQGIPEQFDTSQGLHRIDRRGRARIDWRIRHAQYIDIWDARRDHIVHGDPILRGRSYTDDYMAWFFSITVRVIGQSQYAVSGYEGESSTVRLLTDSVSELVLDTRRALSTTDEDERIQILREMERTGSGALRAIGVDPHTCAPWYGAVRTPDMSYTPSPYASHMPSPHIPHMSSFDAAQMPPLFHPQMAASSSSYIPQMPSPGTSWPHEYDTFFSGPSVYPDERVERVSQSVDDPTASVIPEQHDQQISSTDIGEEPSQQEQPTRTFLRRSKRPRAPRRPCGT
ncbi:uncharacterized protein [Elaeis guineensis]|uniref:uncharacterized protein n=1 Tax=Elaeis guineensis var. tenera TaxID=51953 RepID=UPI003C6D4387